MDLIITKEKENIKFANKTIEKEYEIKTLKEIASENNIIDDNKYDCIYLLVSGSFIINNKLPFISETAFNSLEKKYFFMSFSTDFCFSGFLCFQPSFFCPMLFLFGEDFILSISDFISFDQTFCFFCSKDFLDFKINSVDEYKYYFDNFKNFKSIGVATMLSTYEFTIFSKFKLIKFCSEEIKDECSKFFIDNLNLSEKNFLINSLMSYKSILNNEFTISDKKKINYLINEYPLEKLNEVLKSA